MLREKQSQKVSRASRHSHEALGHHTGTRDPRPSRYRRERADRWGGRAGRLSIRQGRDGLDRQHGQRIGQPQADSERFRRGARAGSSEGSARRPERRGEIRPSGGSPRCRRRARLDTALAELEVARHGVEIARRQVDRAQYEADNANALEVSAEADTKRAEVTAGDAGRDRTRKRKLATTGDVAPADAERSEASFGAANAGVASAKARSTAAAQTVAAERAQVEVARAELYNASATVQLREAAVRQARIDVDHLSLRSPIDGVIVERNITIGQSVGMSAATPPLFSIAGRPPSSRAARDGGRSRRREDGGRSACNVRVRRVSGADVCRERPRDRESAATAANCGRVRRGVPRSTTKNASCFPA